MKKLLVLNQVWKRMRCRAKDSLELSPVFYEQGNTNGGDQEREPRRVPQRPVGKSFNQTTDESTRRHRQAQYEEKRKPGRMLDEGQPAREINAQHRSKHENIAVRKIDEPQHAVDHRVTKGNQRVNAPELHP